MDLVPSINILQVSDLLQVVSPQTRLEIILAIGMGEACVCHLEAVLKQRQAYISQHLMSLREAGVITARRDGRYIFYRLAMRIAGQPPEALQEAMRLAAQGCNCPNCAPTTDDATQQTCSSQNA
jgi:DNA-binding transcriptional ArsR family regulator